MGLIEKIIHLFRPGTDLSKIYTASMLPRELPEFHPYPRKDFLGVNGVHDDSFFDACYTNDHAGSNLSSSENAAAES